MKRAIISLSMFFCLLGCGTNNEGNQIERTKLFDAKIKWEKAMTTNVTGYVYTSESYFFGSLIGPVRVSVNNDSISSVIEIPSQNVLVDTAYKYNIRTVNQWFSWIAKEIDRKPYVLTVEYDEVLGYPIDIIYDGSSEIMDDELRHKNDSLSLIYRIAE